MKRSKLPIAKTMLRSFRRGLQDIGQTALELNDGQLANYSLRTARGARVPKSLDTDDVQAFCEALKQQTPDGAGFVVRGSQDCAIRIGRNSIPRMRVFLTALSATFSRVGCSTRQDCGVVLVDIEDETLGLSLFETRTRLENGAIEPSGRLCLALLDLSPSPSSPRMLIRRWHDRRHRAIECSLDDMASAAVIASGTLKLVRSRLLPKPSAPPASDRSWAEAPEARNNYLRVKLAARAAYEELGSFLNFLVSARFASETPGLHKLRADLMTRLVEIESQLSLATMSWELDMLAKQEGS